VQTAVHPKKRSKTKDPPPVWIGGGSEQSPGWIPFPLTEEGTGLHLQGRVYFLSRGQPTLALPASWVPPCLVQRVTWTPPAQLE